MSALLREDSFCRGLLQRPLTVWSAEKETALNGTSSSPLLQVQESLQKRDRNNVKAGGRDEMRGKAVF